VWFEFENKTLENSLSTINLMSVRQSQTLLVPNQMLSILTTKAAESTSSVPQSDEDDSIFKSKRSPVAAASSKYNLDGSVEEMLSEFQRPLKKPAVAGSNILNLQQSLRLNVLPENIIARSDKLAVIELFVQQFVHQRQGRSLYISGNTGTGKTLSIEHARRSLAIACGTVQSSVLSAAPPPGDAVSAKKYRLRSNLNRNDLFVFVQINCMALVEPSQFFPILLHAIKSETIPAEDSISLKATIAEVAANELQAILIPQADNVDSTASNNCFALVAVDEIDCLLSKSQTVLYRLFEWCHMINSRIAVIGVSNAISMTERFLPRLTARGSSPLQLIFEPYEAKELLAIVQQRISSVERAGDIFETSALELCCRTIASSSGDARRCLEMCRYALERIVESGSSRVNTSDMSAIVAICQGIGRNEALIQNLPRLQQVAVCSLFLCFKLLVCACVYGGGRLDCPLCHWTVDSTRLHKYRSISTSSVCLHALSKI
jgi:Cdc6-like AAA superfamily ATPase